MIKQSEIGASPRPLAPAEAKLIRKLLVVSGRDPGFWGDLDRLRVVDMDDGGMGSLADPDRSAHQFGDQLAEVVYLDADGVPVNVTLNSNESGKFYELDSFKGDFSPLIRIADV